MVITRGMRFTLSVSSTSSWKPSFSNIVATGNRVRLDGVEENAAATCLRWLWCKVDDGQFQCCFFPALPTTPAWLWPPEREAGCANGPSFAAGFVRQWLG